MHFTGNRGVLIERETRTYSNKRASGVFVTIELLTRTRFEKAIRRQPKFYDVYEPHELGNVVGEEIYGHI